MAHQLEDDGFHEIQLNGKQLVFLFMAATVVSVVIFLCGVLVGRGVRAERGAVADASTATNTPDTIAPQPASPAPPAQPQAGTDPTAAQPPGAGEDLSYFRRLEKTNTPQERLKTAGSSGTTPPAANVPAGKAEKKAPKAETPVPAKASAPEPAPPKEAPSKEGPPKETPPKETPRAALPADSAAAAEPTGDGFAVQIAALGVRSDADAIARRLSSKGYAAYVITPANGTPSVFRVRVGKFPTRREAESVAARLQREEQFKPWVTR